MSWRTEGEAPTLVDVVVRDREVAKLLEPGEVRRVRAVERAVDTPEGAVDGLEVWMEFEGKPQADDSARGRGLREGQKVRYSESATGSEVKIGILHRFITALVEVDGRKFMTGLRHLEPVDSPDEPRTGTGGAEGAPNGS